MFAQVTLALLQRCVRFVGASRRKARADQRGDVLHVATHPGQDRPDAGAFPRALVQPADGGFVRPQPPRPGRPVSFVPSVGGTWRGVRWAARMAGRIRYPGIGHDLPFASGVVGEGARTTRFPSTLLKRTSTPRLLW